MAKVGRGVRRANRKGKEGGQSIVETALTFVIYAVIVFAIIDLGRVIYYQNVVNRAADAAALDMTLPESQATDCLAWQDAAEAGNGITITIDPDSVLGNGGGISTPALGKGYLYLDPAMAQTNNLSEPASMSCDAAGTGTRPAGKVTATVTLNFQPWTPFIGTILGPLKITAQSSLQTEYSH